MTQIFFLIDQLAIGLYAILAAVVLWYLYQMLQAQGQVRATYFELERDLATRRRVSAFATMLIVAEVAIVVLGVQMQVVPFLESERTIEERLQAEREQIRDGVFVTDTPAAAVAQGPDIEPGTPLGGVDDVGFVATPTPTPTPVGTLVLNPPASEGCTDERAFLQVPANGMRVFYPVTVRGTAFVDDFVEAKLEIRGPETQNQYRTIHRIDQPVRTLGDFSQFVPSRYEPGVYQFRLVVFDLTRELKAACMVNIYISEPPVTATPTPTADAQNSPNITEVPGSG